MCSQISNITNSLRPYQKLFPELENTIDLLATCQEQLYQANRDIESILDVDDLDLENMHEIEQRVSALHQAARKFQVSPFELEDLWNKKAYAQNQVKHLQNQLDDYENSDFSISTV